MAISFGGANRWRSIRRRIKPFILSSSCWKARSRPIGHERGREQIRFGAYPVHEGSGTEQILGAGGTNQPVTAIEFHDTAGGNEGAAVDLVGNQTPTCQRQTFPMDRH